MLHHHIYVDQVIILITGTRSSHPHLHSSTFQYVTYNQVHTISNAYTSWLFIELTKYCPKLYFNEFISNIATSYIIFNLLVTISKNSYILILYILIIETRFVFTLKHLLSFLLGLSVSQYLRSYNFID